MKIEENFWSSPEQNVIARLRFSQVFSYIVQQYRQKIRGKVKMSQNA